MLADSVLELSISLSCNRLASSLANFNFRSSSSFSTLLRSRSSLMAALRAAVEVMGWSVVVDGLTTTLIVGWAVVVVLCPLESSWISSETGLPVVFAPGPDRSTLMAGAGVLEAVFTTTLTAAAGAWLGAGARVVE